MPDVAISRNRVIELAESLIAIDSQNPPGDTQEIADFVTSFFDRLGITTTDVVSDPAKPNVVAELPGRSERTLLFNGHLDTVPYHATAWSRHPLGEQEGDRLYGRGATDMKGPLAAMLHTAERFVESSHQPPVNLAFAFVSDEEAGGDAGVPTLFERGIIEDLDPDGCVIGETTSTAGRTSVTVADRGSIWLTLEARGKAAHGSRPLLGDNAIDRLWEAITTLRTRLPQRTLTISPELGQIIDESVAYYESSMGEEVARRLFEQPSVNLGTIVGGERINMVPSTARAELDIRVVAGVDTSDILTDIRDCLEDHPAVSIGDVGWATGTYESIDSPLVEAISAAAGTVSDGPVYRRSATGGGDAKRFRNASIPTVEFAFGTDTVHAVDEFTTVDALENNARVYARVPGVWSHP